MYPGAWIGKKANENGILILGESHYGETETTRGVIEFYLSENHKGSRDEWMRFFDRISKSFGYYEMSEEFWDKVFYGNYIEMPCGVGDNKADEAISENRRDYNNSLFSFVNENDINCIVCFSQKVYYAMPDLVGDEFCEEDIEIGKSSGGRRNIARICYYLATDEKRKHCEVSLEKPLTVYQVKHPSRGFDIGQAKEFFYKNKELMSICK
ncbi:hypothetical protein [Eubacterium oxidoreducens]|uniref:Uncharacterized protein n=1 Tax=Eubacterium oxidoreducens TaxID=1732 RepID=A0A1G6C6N0_EUBOX|nr:hypothetical protein [Eubacterium oxidoreducens]SDB28536.1 hypothetical protein SAMN02910417_02122 [Eubacterium oxidoreducens]